jgi:hypothetical protein
LEKWILNLGYITDVFFSFRDEYVETLELSEMTVNPGQMTVGPHDFELLKVLGKGGYGKVRVCLFNNVCMYKYNMKHRKIKLP